MKYCTLAALITLNLGAFAQSGINWESEIVVSDGAAFGNLRPRATVVGNSPVVVYGSSGSENVYISRWNGSGFDTQSVLPTGTSAYMASWTGADIASKGDTVIAVFKMNPMETGNVYVVRSVDGGVTFSDTIRANTWDGGNSWMPSMDMDADGNPVISMMIHNQTWNNPRYALVHSTDAGLTFGPTEDIASSVPGEACDCCPSEVVIDGSKEVLMFRNNDANIRDIFGVLSNDGGATFPYSENVDNTNWIISACPSTGMDAVFSGDNLYTVYASAAEGIYRVYLTESDVSAGLDFTARTKVLVPDPSNGTQNYPTISGENDTLVMAWEERINFNKEVYYAVSIPGQDPMVALSSYKWQANDSTTGSQTNPEILYKNGFVHLFFQDDFTGDLMYKRGQINVSLGIAEMTESNIRLVPNPSANGSMNLSGIKAVLSIMDATGAQVAFSATEQGDSTQVMAEHLESGIYFVHCMQEDGSRVTVKWVVQN